METIRDYIETMFMNIPLTNVTIEMKEELLLNAEDKYEDLLKEGKNDKEIIGIIISEIGQVEELLTNFEDEKVGEPMDGVPDENVPLLSEHFIYHYLEDKKKAGLQIGIGVILCGIALNIFILTVTRNIQTAHILFTFLFIALGVSEFIRAGLNMSEYKVLQSSFLINESDRRKVEELKVNYSKSFSLSMILGVFISIFSVAPLFLMIFSSGDFYWFLISTITLGTIGAFFFIYAGNVQQSYSILLTGISASLSQEAIKKEIKIKKNIEVVWSLVVVLYLLYSFIFQAWSYSWIIFPVVGVVSTFWEKNNE